MKLFEMNKHQVVHIGFSANDPKKAGNFNSNLFRWKVESMEEMDCFTFDGGEGPGGGFPKGGDNTKAGSIIVYISTDDVEASLTNAGPLGTKVQIP